MADLTVSGANGGMYPLGNDGDSARVEGQQKPSIFSFEQKPVKVRQSDDDIRNKLIKMQLNNIMRMLQLLGVNTNDATLQRILIKAQSMDIDKLWTQIDKGEQIDEATFRNVENVEKELCKYFGIDNTTTLTLILDKLKDSNDSMTDKLEQIKAEAESEK